MPIDMPISRQFPDMPMSRQFRDMPISCQFPDMPISRQLYKCQIIPTNDLAFAIVGE